MPGTYLRSRIRVYHKDQKGALHSLEHFDLFERVLEEVSRGDTPTTPRVFSLADRKRMKQIGLNKVTTELDFVIELPWDARSFITILAKADDQGLRRRVCTNVRFRKLYEAVNWLFVVCFPRHVVCTY